MPISRAAVYVIDAQASSSVVHSLFENILERYPSARVVVLAAKHTDAETFELLRMGVKGLLTYSQRNHSGKPKKRGRAYKNSRNSEQAGT
ncbi:MAG: hypothetical protein ACYDCD_01180 [Candidatus Acidiferrales bacterium]